MMSSPGSARTAASTPPPRRLMPPRGGPGSHRGLLLGSALDALLADPRRGHPVAAFGTAASRAENRLWAASRARGALFTLACAGPVAAAGWAPATAGPARPGTAHGADRRGDLDRARRRQPGRRGGGDVPSPERPATWTARGARLPALCGRDPAGLPAAELARATVESVAENTCDAAVAPLLWGAVFGLPGLLGYRAVNTLDAMVGHKTLPYAKFGWAAARLDDVANLVPARMTALLAAAVAPLAGGSGRRALRAVYRDGGAHPSPNAGRCEAAFAGALGVRLGGTNVYQGHAERRGTLGDGPPPAPADIDRAIRLSRAVIIAATLLAALVAHLTRGRAVRFRTQEVFRLHRGENPPRSRKGR